MPHKEFRELELKASIAPSQSQWPTEHLHWQRLGAAADEARSRLGKFLEAVDEIEADPRLSREGKAAERKKAAEKTLAVFAGSRTVARAQESAASVMEKWEAKVAGSIKRASDAHEVAIHAQIREKLAGIKDNGAVAEGVDGFKNRGSDFGRGWMSNQGGQSYGNRLPSPSTCEGYYRWDRQDRRFKIFP